MNLSTHTGSFNDETRIDAVLVTSGTFAFNHPVLSPPAWANAYPPFDLRLETAEIANPMLARPVNYRVLEQAEYTQLGAIQDAYNKAELVTQSDLDSYADALVRIAKQIAVKPLDIMLVPLRGGWKPSIQLQVMNKRGYPLFPFPFTAGSQGRFRNENRECLIERLKAFQGKTALRIGVIDAAITGHGAKALAELLMEVKSEFRGQAWRVTFELLYSNSNPKHPLPKQSDIIPSMSSGELLFERNLHVVPNLVIDDWDEVVGLRVNNGEYLYKPVADGTVLLKAHDNHITVFRSSELSRFVDHLIATSASEAILSDPLLELKRTL